MKILYLTHRFPPDHFRGTEVYTFELAQEMLRRGHRVLVVTLREAGRPGKISLSEDSYGGVSVARIGKHLRPESFEEYFFDSEMDRLFAGLIQDFQPDLIHATYFLGGLSLGMSRVAIERSRLFITITDYSAICPRGQLLDRDLKNCSGPREGIRCLYCLFGKNWIFSNSKYDRLARESLPAPLIRIKKSAELEMIRRRNEAIKRILASAKSVIFAHPYTLSVFKRQKIKAKNPRLLDFGVNFKPFLDHKKTRSDRLRIGFIGQILPHKGLHILVDALAEIEEQESFELLIYGSLADPLEKKYFDSLGLDRVKNQRWLKTFDYSKMNDVLQGIDLLAVPSLWPENCPLVPKYAILTGTRLLISDAPGILLAAEGKGIDSFPLGNAAALREKIEALIQSKNFDQVAEPDQKLVMDIQDHASALEKIYREFP